MTFYPEECKLTSPLIFDTHAHLDDERFKDILPSLLDEMHTNGVDAIITNGCDYASSSKALELAHKYPFIYAAVGIHPQSDKSFGEFEKIRDLCQDERCVAIGEIGLDYYYVSDNKSAQKDIFEQQMLLSNYIKKPVIVHDRDAHEDTLSLLQKHKPCGVVHCFSGSVEMAREINKLGLYIGIGGVLTFKNSKKLPDVAKEFPIEKILLETDCPYLSPEPYRGKTCHSGLITLTAQKLAEIKNLSLENILKITNKNAHRIFKIV